jgi:hypothetical protein
MIADTFQLMTELSEMRCHLTHYTNKRKDGNVGYGKIQESFPLLTVLEVLGYRIS